MELKEEMHNLIKVSFCAYISLGYCFFIGKIVPKGVTRLLTILPVVIVFLVIPLVLTSVHSIGAVSFFISWLANFKLILFAFEKGPLSSPSIPLVTFFAMACFPIEVTRPTQVTRHARAFSKAKNPKVVNYVTKSVLVAVFLRVYYNHRDVMNPMLAWVFFGLSVYLMLELLVTLSSSAVGLCLKLDLNPQFDEPYLATSLQDFWGRRWNVMVSRVLHPTIYDPMIKLSIPLVGRWAHIPAILLTFAVSGLMHELIFFYFSRAWPTWEVMLFFCLHGVCLVMEVAIKKVIKVNWSLPRQFAAPLVVTFVLATSYWLFLPELLRSKMIDRAFEEYHALSELGRDVVRTLPIIVSKPNAFASS